MRIPSLYRVLEDGREASLEFAAACVENYAALHPRGERRPRDCDSADEDGGAEDEEPQLRGAQDRARASSHCRDRGDFLYDWMRLHINYMNQMAMLGSSYSAVVARGLEALYHRGSDCEPARRYELELNGVLGEHAVARFCVRNSLRESAELDVDGLEYGSLQLKFHQIGARSRVVKATVAVLKDAGAAFEPCELGRGERAWLVVRVALAGFEPRHRYRAELPIRVGERSKPLCLVVRVVQA
jgi:hypothetical protein